MNSHYLSLKQMAEAIGLNYSTARGYVDQFKQYFHRRKMEGVRWPVYDAGDQAILKLIKDIRDQGGQTYEVQSALEDRYGFVIEHPSPDNSEIVSSPITADVARTMELLKTGQVGIEYALTSLQFYRELVGAKNAEIEYKDAKIEALEAEIERLRRNGAGH